MNFSKLSFLLLATSFTGCASILSGTSQTMTIQSNPAGARCELVREGRIVGVVEKTPGAVTLDKTKHDINIQCSKKGYSDSRDYAQSGSEPATFGNILLGGLIGWGIDSASGADNMYPEVVTVSLSPKSFNESFTDNSDVSTSSNLDPMSKLTQLKQLRESGLLTEREYQAKKSSILKNL